MDNDSLSTIMKPSEFTLKAIRKIYIKTFGMPKVCLPQEKNRDVVSDIIYKFLADDKPCMIARYGATELSMVVNYLGITTKTHSIYRFIKGQEPEWWWNHNIMMQMQQWSGFFPPTEEKLSQFCRLMLDDAKEMDICGVFSSVEPLMRYVEPYMSSPLYVPLYTYSPFVSTRPWSRILKGKKVLVIHPFAELIVRQYQRREQLFDNPDVLPEFDLWGVWLPSRSSCQAAREKSYSFRRRVTVIIRNKREPLGGSSTCHKMWVTSRFLSKIIY